MRIPVLVALLALPLAADDERNALPVLPVAELRAYEAPVAAAAPGAPPRTTLGLLLEETEASVGAIVRTVTAGGSAERARTSGSGAREGCGWKLEA